MEQKRPRAVSKEGKIGSVSCYVLDDGRCVLAKRTVLSGIQPGASGSGDLNQYLANLSKRIDGLALPEVFEFTLPGGGVAEAIEDEAFASIIQAYVDGLVLGKLHVQQIPVAQRAYELQKSWARVGLRAHILTVTGVEPVTAVQKFKSFAERIFRREPRDWDRRFSNEFVEAICELYGWKMDGKRVPQQMAAVFDKLYRMILGNDGKAALKARNPDPRHRSNHHQHLSDEVDHELQSITRAIIYIAHRSNRNVDYFWKQVQELLGIAPIQYELEASCWGRS